MDSYDVVVVGAGLAGLRCAFDLARIGLSVALLERQRAPGARIPTSGIFVRKTLEDFPMPAQCFGPWVSDVVLHSPAGRTLLLHARRPEFRVARMRDVYDHLLARCIVWGVRWMPESTFVDCYGDGAMLRLSIRAHGGTKALRARCIVGADGARSRVARALGLSVNRETIVGLEHVVQGARLPGSPVFHCFLDPRLAPGYIAWLVDDGEELHLGTAGYPDRFDPRAALRSFYAKMEGAFDLRGARLVERRGGCIPVGGILPTIACRRGLLVGDAAGAPSPLTAGGIDACFRLSSLAADVLHRHLALGDSAALSAYRGDRFRTRFWSRSFLRRALSGLRGSGTVELAFAALGSPLLVPLARRIFFNRGSFPNVRVGRAVAAFEPFPPYGVQ